MELQVGLTSRVELIVTDADTAQALGSGDVPVLGTPRLIALAEAATVAATAATSAPAPPASAPASNSITRPRPRSGAASPCSRPSPKWMGGA